VFCTFRVTLNIPNQDLVEKRVLFAIRLLLLDGFVQFVAKLILMSFSKVACINGDLKILFYVHV